MDDDHQVAVLLHLNINDTEGREPKSIDPTWQNDFTPHEISISESSGSSNGQELNKSFGENNLFQKDLEFLKQHATGADPDFLNSLLSSEIHNPKRLETIMCDLLNIPQASELIRKFRGGNTLKTGDKRPIDCTSEAEPEEVKRKKSKDTEGYLQQIRDIFPDADGLFLISECQQLESWEDCSRFINTVMLSGMYPKKGAIEYSPAATETPKVVDIINDTEYRSVIAYSSDEEVTSSVVESHSKNKGRSVNSLNFTPIIDASLPVEIEVVDITSDNTEPYDPPDSETLQEIYNSNYKVNDPNLYDNNAMDVEEIASPTWESSLADDIDNLLEKKFNSSAAVKDNSNQDTLENPRAGPSGLQAIRPRLSLPNKAIDSGSPEKSLAEIIEERRHERRRSFPASNALHKPSTSKAEPFSVSENITIIEDGTPEISITSDFPKNGVEPEATIPDEVEELSKISEQWLDEQTANLVRIFPNTDPSYLREEVVNMNGSLEKINEFVISKLEKNDMPTRKEYEKKMEMEELQNRYTSNFSIEDFLKAVPDPWKYFTQGNRNCSKYKSHSLCYLKSAFKKRFVRDIIDTFNRNNHNLYLSYQDLKKEGLKKRSNKRSEFECNNNRPTTIDIQFLQEVAFIENEEKIKDFLESEKVARQMKFDEAKLTGSLLECQCCFDSEVMVEDIVYCPKDHPFCKDCVIKSVEVEMGNGRCQFECLSNCEEKFTLACLQNVLKPELFSKVIQANQIEEIRAAEIDDLVQCPFCNYATIMPPEEKVMTCLNPECLKESCRLCKELNHIPLRCDEVEKSEEVKMRTYIENKMTEALVRTCYKCGKKFVKEDGCNKMTCTCGAKMCYVCRKPVSGYSHFNGQGGTEYHKCPLYSKNDELHIDLVQRVGEEAKAKVLQENPQTKLLYDPTIIMPERSQETPMPGMNDGAAFNFAMRAIRGIGQGEINEEGEDQNQQREERYNRRRLRREENIHHHRHRQPRPEVEIELDEEDEDENDHNHYHYHHRRRRIHHEEPEHRHHHHQQIQEHRHRHHHRHPPWQ